ncbi:glycosyltransferase family 4 protein [Halospina sp. K52047b]|uniref:glycosyltransferase family 4 protein n=1 Tax=Halospina sp. K52047b TaxID=2614160 RepID=UPI00124A1D69|nr:glycosyltransferase family 4 protein [Halospina sp. K52047b]KAA8981919.1 glycosyltransferase family 4 protein [Halospina sp. K52047b]
MEHLVYRIGEILAEFHSVEVIGPQRVSSRIAERFHCTAWGELHPALIWRLLCRDPVTRRIVRLVLHGKHSKPDVLLALGSIGVNGLAVAIAGRILGIPSVVRLTSDIFNVYKTKVGLRAKLKLFLQNNLLGRLSMRLADRILLLHEAQRSGLTAIGLDSNRMQVVPQPVSFATDGVQNEASIREGLNIHSNDRIVLSTMRLDTDKHIDKLVEVINCVLENSAEANCHFVLVGDGQCRDYIAEKIRHHSRHVHMVGEQPSTQLPNYYRVADMFLHLSKGEGLSNCLLEALYFQLPVVATDSGTITRGMISTIINDPQDIANAILHKKIPTDSFPETLDPEINRSAWLKAIDAIDS